MFGKPVIKGTRITVEHILRKLAGGMMVDDILADHSATFITPEDIVVAKLSAYRETGSDKHLRDARGVLTMQWGELNLEAIRRGAHASDVIEPFENLLEAVRPDGEA